MPRTGRPENADIFVSVTSVTPVARSRRRHEFFGLVGGWLWMAWIHVASCQVGKAWRTHTCNRTSKPTYVKSWTREHQWCQELAVAERQVSELKLQESDLELQAEEYQALISSPFSSIYKYLYLVLVSRMYFAASLLQKWIIDRSGNPCWKQTRWWFESCFVCINCLFFVWRHRKLQKSKKW